MTLATLPRKVSARKGSLSTAMTWWPEPVQLERGGRAEAAEPDDEDVVVVRRFLAMRASRRGRSVRVADGVQATPREPAGSVPIMPTQARVVWDEGFTGYDFGPTHPMAPLRLDLTARLCEALGVFDAEGVEVVGPRWPTTTLLATVHDADYVAAVQGAPRSTRAVADRRRGLGTEDDPAFVGMHEASARIAAGHARRLPARCGRARPRTA